MAWPKGKPRPGAFGRKAEPPKSVAEIVKEETIVIPEAVPNATLNGETISLPAAAENPTVKIVLDKPEYSAVLLRQEGKMPPRVKQDMINHCRLLKGMFRYEAQVLAKEGVDIKTIDAMV